MKKIPPQKIPPKVARNYREIIAEEMLAFWSFITSNWYYVITGIVLLVVLVHIVRPVPPNHLRIATGQPNSTFDAIGEQYREFFKKQGVHLTLVKTLGAEENNKLLLNGEVDAIFSQGGIHINDPNDDIRSLGSISFQPLWLFYRGQEVPNIENLNRFLEKRKTSINVVGSGTRLLTETIFKLHGIDSTQKNFKPLNSSDSIAALKSGEIDGMFLVAGVESNNLMTLINIPDIHTFNFDLSDGYTKRLRYLDMVVLPKGALRFNPVSPANNINMVATTVTILTTNELHPALQLLLLEAASEFDSQRIALFNKEVHFPAYTDMNIPESDVAQRYYKSGSPFLWGRAPYWIASLFDEIWFYLLAAGAILIPLLSFIPSYRKTHAELSIEECYTVLRSIERRVLNADTDNDLQTLSSEIDLLKHRVWRLWVPSGCRNPYYDLRSAVLAVKHDISEQLSQLQAKNF